MTWFFCKIGSLNRKNWPEASFRPKRLVYANTEDSSTSETAEAVTYDQIKEAIQQLKEDHKDLQDYVVSKAVYVLDTLEQRKDEAGKQKLWEATKSFTDKGRIGYENELDAIVGMTQRPEAASTEAASTETAPEGTSATEPADASGSTGASIGGVQSEVSEEITKALETIEATRRQVEIQQQPNNQMIKKLKELSKDLSILNEKEKNSQPKTKELLTEAVQKGYLNEKEARKIVNLYKRNDEDTIEIEMSNILKGMIESDDDDKKELADKIVGAKRSEKNQHQDIMDDFKKMLSKLRQNINDISDLIYQEGYRERAIKEYSRNLGVDLQAGTVMVFKDKRAKIDKEGNRVMDATEENFVYEPILRKATIVDVSFQNVDLKDADGNVIRSVPDLAPQVTIAIEDEWPDENGIRNKNTETMSASILKKHMDTYGMVRRVPERQDTDEVMEEINFVKQITGINVLKPQAKFQYRTAHIDEKKGILKGKDHTVTVKDIYKAEDEFFNTENSAKKGLKQTLIELDEEVLVATETESGKPEKKNVLTLGEFARWYKRQNAIEAMELTAVILKLKELQKERNAHYQRSEQQYPPIECVEGEQLYYNTPAQPTFRIKKVDDSGITLDNGSHFTPATFYSWVKENEVEKKTADAEAHKATDVIDDEEEKKKAFEEAKKKAEEEMAKRAAKDPAKDALDNDTAPAGSSIDSLRRLWNQTYFLSLHDFYTMGKTIYEFIVRKLDRREKDRVGAIGNAAFSPFYAQLGSEFKTIQQNAENEEVNRSVEAFKQMGPGQLYKELKTVTNKDILKAILTTLADKGAIRWEDPILWHALTEISKGYSARPKEVARYDENLMREILDEFWGEQSYADFKSKNDGAYESTKSKFQDVARRLENDEVTDLPSELSKMLYKHMHGEYIDPAVYEAYIHFAIEAGKMGFENKIYYLMMSMVAKGGPTGQQLLTISRISELETKLMNNFPALDYFTHKQLPAVDPDTLEYITEPGPDGKPPVEKFNIKHVQKIFKDYIAKDQPSIKDWKDLRPKGNFMDFVRKEVMYNANVQERFKKAASDMGRWDHDDFHMWMPQMSEDMADSMTIKGMGATKVSIPGLKNAFAGANNFTRIQMEEFMKNQNDDEKSKENLVRMLRPMRAFIRLHAILDSRMYHHVGHDRGRLSKRDLEDKPGVDPNRNVSVHIAEMNIFIGNLIDGMDAAKDRLSGDARNQVEKVKNLWVKVMEKNAKNKSEQERIMKEFGQELEDATLMTQESLGSHGMAVILEAAQAGDVLKGIPGAGAPPLKK